MPKKRIKTFTRNNGYSEKDLLHCAIDHLGSAGVLFERNPRCYDSAGYLSHLGIEMLIKSIILFYKNEFPNTHSLRLLVKILSGTKAGIFQNISHKGKGLIRKLDSFKELRYPNPKRPIEIGSEDWKENHNLFLWLLDRMPDYIQEQVRGIDHIHKTGRVLMKKAKT